MFTHIGVFLSSEPKQALWRRSQPAKSRWHRRWYFFAAHIHQWAQAALGRNARMELGQAFPGGRIPRRNRSRGPNSNGAHVVSTIHHCLGRSGLSALRRPRSHGSTRDRRDRAACARRTPARRNYCLLPSRTGEMENGRRLARRTGEGVSGFRGVLGEKRTDVAPSKG